MQRLMSHVGPHCTFRVAYLIGLFHSVCIFWCLKNVQRASRVVHKSPKLTYPVGKSIKSAHPQGNAIKKVGNAHGHVHICGVYRTGTRAAVSGAPLPKMHPVLSAIASHLLLGVELIKIEQRPRTYTHKTVGVVRRRTCTSVHIQCVRMAACMNARCAGTARQ